MNRALAIRTIQILARLPELHTASWNMALYHSTGKRVALEEELRTCRIIIDDAAQLAKELKELCETSRESTLGKTEHSQSSDPAVCAPKST